MSEEVEQIEREAELVARRRERERLRYIV